MHGIGYNWVFNWNFEIWGAGTTSVPTGYTLVGAGATIAKNTTAGQFKYGTASLALTRVGTDCYIYQDVDLIADQGPAAAWGSRPVILGCWVRATVASRARLFADDGVTSTYSSYHTGGGSLEFLTVSVTLGASPTRVRVVCIVDSGNTTAQFDGMTLISAPATVKHATQSSVSDLGVATEVGPDEWNADHSLTLTDSIPSGWRGRKCVLACGSEAQQAQATTIFYAANGVGSSSTNEVDTQIRVPYKGVIRNFYCTVDVGVGGAGQTAIFHVRKNGANLTPDITVTINSGASSGSDTTNEGAFAVNDQLSFQIITSATTGSLRFHAAVEYEEIP